MPITHKKKYGIYHWDTFDNETILISSYDTLENAMKAVQKRYAGRIGSNGADRVDIVDKKGRVIASYSVK